MIISKMYSGRQYYFAVYRHIEKGVKPFALLEDALEYAATFNEDLIISESVLPHFAEYLKINQVAVTDQ